jgi:hypothetical protein
MDILSKRFRSNSNDVDMTRMENSKRSILNVALYTGMESRMLYTMIHVAYGRKTLLLGGPPNQDHQNATTTSNTKGCTKAMILWSTISIGR